jgi:hypothetical protein
MAYDSARGQVVLFGGDGGGDTWVWDGSNWAPKSPQSSPPRRSWTAMAYDAAHGQTVLFGGFTGTTSNILGDTWLWDGSDWTQEVSQNSAPARYAHGIVYDSAHQQVLLYAGFVPSGDIGDTWAWDGSNWTQLSSPTTPGSRDTHAMAYDSGHDEVVLFGGEAAVVLGDTWTRSGGAIANSPTISGVMSASAFGGFSSVAPGSWIEIYGSNFATDTRMDWRGFHRQSSANIARRREGSHRWTIGVRRLCVIGASGCTASIQYCHRHTSTHAH